MKRLHIPHAPLLGVVTLMYVVLTLFYSQMGYLDRLEKTVVPHDPAFYYVYMPSIFLDGDIDFTNDYEQFKHLDIKAEKTATGMYENHYPIGQAILASPAFLAAHVYSLIADAAGGDVPTDGYSDIYFSWYAVCLSLWGFAGLLLLALALREVYGGSEVEFACFCALFCSGLAYYIWPLTAYSHSPAFFAVSLFVYMYMRHGVSAYTVAAAALMFLVRWQDILYTAPVIVEGVAHLWNNRQDAAAIFKRYAAYVALFLVLIFPQLLVWNILYGSFITMPSGAQVVDFTNLRPFEVLFSMRNGLFLWHPFLLAGVAGLFLLWKTNKQLSYFALGGVIVQLLFVASLQKDDGVGFGQRFLVSMTPLIAIGFAALFRYASKRWRAAIVAVACVFLVWNQLFYFQYWYGLIPRASTISFKQLTTDKFRLGELLQSEQYFQYVLRNFNDTNSQELLRTAKSAVELDPQNEKKLLALGYLSLRTKNFTEGYKAFFRLFELRPEKEIYIPGLTFFLIANGQESEAVNLLEYRDTTTSQMVLRRLQAQTPIIDAQYYKQLYERLVALHLS